MQQSCNNGPPFVAEEFPHGNCVYILYTKIVQDVHKIYKKCIQNVYHISANFCIYFVYKIKRTMTAKFCKQMYTKVCWNVGFILYTNMLYIFCIHQFLSTKSIHNKHYVYNFYTKFIQNVYTNNCMQNGWILISTSIDPFVVQFLVNHCKQLRLETCWLITGSTYQINGLLDYILH